MTFVGCARRGAVTSGPPAILRLSQRNEPTDLDPATAGLPDDFFVIRALSEGLVVPVPGEGPRPGAAESWEFSADNLTCTFHLRKDERWSNGEPLTADDFIASFRRVLTPGAAAPKADLLFVVRNARAYFTGRISDFAAVGFRSPDPRTLVVTLEKPTPQFLAYAASGPWVPVNPRIVERYGSEWTRPAHYVGNGPYVLAEWLPNQRIVVRKNPNYRDTAGISLGEIQFIRFDDGDAEERAYRAGQVDLTMAVPISKLDTYRRERPAELHRSPLAETRILTFNTRRPPLDDVRVRRALSLAIDRAKIVTDLLRGGQEPANRLLPAAIAALEVPSSAGAKGALPVSAQGNPDDVAEARRLLAEAGFPNGSRFPRLELSGWDRNPALEAIQDMWKKNLGIEVSLAIREARVHVSALRSGLYDIGFITLIPDVADPLAALENFTSGSPNNLPHWSDGEYDAALAGASKATNPAQRAEELQKAEARLLDQRPLAPLYFNAKNWLMRPQVHGWKEDELWTRYYPGLSLDNLSVAKQDPKILRIGNGTEPQDLDPQTVTGVPEHRIIMAVFEGLVNEDPRDLHPVPGLAKSWDISPDQLTYTFHLRDNLRWSNGDPLTADDFVQSYRRILTPALGSEYAYLVYNFVAGADDYYHGRLDDFSKVGFKALDERTLRVTLAHPTAFLLRIIATHYSWDVVPVKVIARFGSLFDKRTPWTRAGNLVGDGPYILKEWRPSQKLVLSRNPNYWDAANVKLDEIEFYPTEDISTEERMFRTGQLDATNVLPSDKIDVYRSENPRALHIEPYLGVYFYRCNTERGPLKDKRVRRALAMAIDRESLVRDVLRGGQQPAYAVSYPGTAGYAPLARLTGGVSEARKLLAEAGYPGGQGFPKIQLLYNTQQTNRQIAEAIQAMWRKNLGVEIQIQNEEWKVYLDAQHTHNFELERAGWIADYMDPHVFLEIWETGNGNNNTQWSSPEYDRLLHAALAEPNEAERYQIYQKMDAILVDECPVIPIYYYTSVYLLNPKVKGWWPNLLDHHPWQSVDIER